MNSRRSKIIANVIGTASYNLLLLVNLGAITSNLKAETFTDFTFVVAASGLSAVIFGAGIPAWLQINLAEPKKMPQLEAGIARAPFAIVMLQCLAGVVAFVSYFYYVPAEQGATVLTIYLLQMAMTISFLADGVAIGQAVVWFLNVRRLIPEILFSSYLVWSLVIGGNFEQVAEAYALSWIITAAVSIPFVIKRIGFIFCIDRSLWLLVWKASAYLQWALAQAGIQRGSVLIAASYGTYETVVLYRWAQIIATTATHAYNAIAQVAFPLHKARNVTSRISLMAALNLAEVKTLSAIGLATIASLTLTGLYYLVIEITSELSLSTSHAIVFTIFSIASIAYLFSSTETNWRGLRIQYLLSQYVILTTALLILTLSVIIFSAELSIPNVSYLLWALATGKAAGFLFLMVSRPIEGGPLPVDRKRS